MFLLAPRRQHFREKQFLYVGQFMEISPPPSYKNCSTANGMKINNVVKNTITMSLIVNHKYENCLCCRVSTITDL